MALPPGVDLPLFLVIPAKAGIHGRVDPGFRRDDDQGSSGSVIRGAAVDVDRLAGDEAAAVADEKQAGGGDLVDVTLAAERDAGAVRRPVAVPFRVVAPCVDAARRDDVDAD